MLRRALTEEYGGLRRRLARLASALPQSKSSEWRKSRRQSGSLELEQPLGLIDPGQLMLAEVVDLVSRVELLARPLREEDLAPAAGLADARGPMHVQTEVGRVADDRLACVKPHADAQLYIRGPLVRGECLLGGHGCLRRGFGVGEHDEELVTALVDDDAVGLLDGFAEESPVVVEDLRVAVAETL